MSSFVFSDIMTSHRINVTKHALDTRYATCVKQLVVQTGGEGGRKKVLSSLGSMPVSQLDDDEYALNAVELASLHACGASCVHGMQLVDRITSVLMILKQVPLYYYFSIYVS